MVRLVWQFRKRVIKVNLSAINQELYLMELPPEAVTLWTNVWGRGDVGDCLKL